jgi:hypothetical protein
MMFGIGRPRQRGPSRETRSSEPRSRLWNCWQSRERRGEELLREWLTPSQARQYLSHNSFDVVGCDTGRRYRIHRGRVMNIAELDTRGNVARQWCVVPQGALAIGDIMLAQKIALERREIEALTIARGSQGTASLGTMIFCQFGALILMTIFFTSLMWFCALI